jgi:toxin CcdB
MEQFSLYANQDPSSNEAYPYFVDVQNDLLSELNSRLVIPLTPLSKLNNRHAKQLCPVFEIAGDDLVLLTHQMTAAPVKILKTKVGSLAERRYEILAAIDLLISGI